MIGYKRCRAPTRSAAAHQTVARSRIAFLRCDATSNNKFFVGGNWKSNGTKASIKDLISGLNAGSFDPSKVDVVIAPTFVHLDAVNTFIDKQKFSVAAQNMWIKGTGAYTGEIAGETLLDLGVSWVILGHSERRALCSESNELVGQKTARALELGMKVIPCIGETLEQRQTGHMYDVLTAQMEGLFAQKVRASSVFDAWQHKEPCCVQTICDVKDWSRVVLAYEPVWAIGTGERADDSTVSLPPYARHSSTARRGGHSGTGAGGARFPAPADRETIGETSSDADAYLVRGVCERQQLR